MVHLFEHLTIGALEYVKAKGTADDTKAGMDLGQIDFIRGNLLCSPEYVQAGIELDARLNNEYPEIRQLCNAANRIMSLSNQKDFNATMSRAEAVGQALRTDYFGILAGVLIKHKVVDGLGDYIERVE